MDALKEHLNSLLQVEDRVVLFSGMYVDLRGEGLCVVQLDCFHPFVVLSRDNFKLIQLKLEKYDETRVIESLEKTETSTDSSCLHFEKDFIGGIRRALKSNITVTEKQRLFGVTSIFIN